MVKTLELEEHFLVVELILATIETLEGHLLVEESVLAAVVTLKRHVLVDELVPIRLRPFGTTFQS